MYKNDERKNKKIFDKFKILSRITCNVFLLFGEQFL